MTLLEQPAEATAGTIRSATLADVPFTSETLARAFHDDPIMGWIFPDDARRPAILRTFFDVAARRVYLRYGETYVYGDRTAAAMWAPPGKWKLSPMDILRNAPSLGRVMGGRLFVGLRATLLAERGHPLEPHYYLAVLGTDPVYQGRGIGSRLLSHMLARSDDEGIPSYLESSSEGSKRLYLRHGFRVMEEVPLPGGGPPFWRMWRDVGAAGSFGR
jgi:ribosomal protein S18 acetylase RimI-like enzyme